MPRYLEHRFCRRSALCDFMIMKELVALNSVCIIKEVMSWSYVWVGEVGVRWCSYSLWWLEESVGVEGVV